MKKTIICLLCVMFLLPIKADDINVITSDTIKTDSVIEKYTSLIEKLQREIQQLKADSALRQSPYFFRTFAQGTLYDAPLKQEFGLSWQPTLPGRTVDTPSIYNSKDFQSTLLKEENERLMDMYVTTPQLVKTTETELEENGGIHDGGLPETPTDVKIHKQNIAFDIIDDEEPIKLDVKRPNFWKFRGNYSLQFTQTYFSDNWYQGGENNYSMLALATMEANFDNKQKVQWDNKLEMRLGFQTSKSDEKHKIKSNDDLLRFTSKIGYKATKHWFYTLQVQAYTQFYPSFRANSFDVSSDFMSPFNLVVSLGMDYKFEWKKFRGSANLSPIAYNFKSVARPSLYGNFGLEPGKKVYNNFGPNITVNYTWEICKNIRWDARIYWFSNMKMTDIEWENTFTFSINKYLNSKLFLYPRIDDSSERYKSENGSYLMFKEWFSLGVNYSF